MNYRPKSPCSTCEAMGRHSAAPFQRCPECDAITSLSALTDAELITKADDYCGLGITHPHLAGYSMMIVELARRLKVRGVEVLELRSKIPESL